MWGEGEDIWDKSFGDGSSWRFPSNDAESDGWGGFFNDGSAESPGNDRDHDDEWPSFDFSNGFEDLLGDLDANIKRIEDQFRTQSSTKFEKLPFDSDKDIARLLDTSISDMVGRSIEDAFGSLSLVKTEDEDKDTDGTTPFLEDPDERLSDEMDKVMDWLARRKYLPADVTPAKRGRETVIEISYDGDKQIDLSSLKTRTPVVLRRSMMELQRDFGSREAKYDPVNPFRSPRPTVGSSIGMGVGNGTLGMYLRDPKTGDIYVLSCGHCFIDFRNGFQGYKSSRSREIYSPGPTERKKSERSIRTALTECSRRLDRLSSYISDLRRNARRGGRFAGRIERKMREAKQEYERQSSAYQVWRTRADDLRGDIRLCTGYIAEYQPLKTKRSLFGLFNNQMMDWGIAKVTNLRRVKKNVVTIGDRTFRFGSRWLEGKPKTGMIVCKSGRSTGFTLGRVVADSRHINDAGVKLFLCCVVGLSRSETEKHLRKLGVSIYGLDGREMVTSRHSAKGDSGSTILSFPDFRPIGILTSGGPNLRGKHITGFLPISIAMERIKTLTGMRFEIL